MTKRPASCDAYEEFAPGTWRSFAGASTKRQCYSVRYSKSGGSTSNGIQQSPPSPSGPLQRSASMSSDEELAMAHSRLGSTGSCPGPSSAGQQLAAATSIEGLVCAQDSLQPAQPLVPPLGGEEEHLLQTLASCCMSYMEQGTSTGPANPSRGPLALLGPEGFSSAPWRAFAELNVLMSHHFSSLPTAMLRGYHSFTRAPRAQLWARFALSQGAQSGEEHLLGHGCGPLHAQMTRFLLEYVLDSFPTAALLVYTIAVPHWLTAWCARWGHPGGTMRVIALLAHEQDATGQSAAPRALYIPCAAA